ncbi:hypothetical protein SSABA_v1c08090 [Spiroplasma sabaudiense Ar-1343]|uniref:Uncharacterized protein n=1 Tax=Spiroplasma sabaudiense Ar-1343 TaxID=1276257 RepID=W6AAN2_9MOLU|nr:hypothetical protein [Spiroplasma sabaudiense]AHI54208.1 hypothetical protein SSABA_v1c08090 [Spiroplasma sabaudiense Ar-1343]
MNQLKNVFFDVQSKEFKIQDKKSNAFQMLKDYIDANDNITLPKVCDIINEAYPYLDLKIKTEIIENSIERDLCVRKIISDSILKKTKLIPLIIESCEDKFHQQLAKRIITEMNQLIYKYNVTKINCNEVLWISNEIFLIGQVPFLFKTNKGILLVDIRTGRTNFEERIQAQQYLYEILINESLNDKVFQKIIINPRLDICVQNVETPERKVLWNLKSLMSWKY